MMNNQHSFFKSDHKKRAASVNCLATLLFIRKSQADILQTIASENICPCSAGTRLKFWFDQSVGVAFTFVNNIDLLGFGIQEYIEAMS